MEPNKPNTYTCAECGEKCESERPDAEAHAEAIALWGCAGDAPGMAIVCDDCYRAIMRRMAN